GLQNNYKELLTLRRDNPELFNQGAGTINFSGSVQRQAQFVSGNKEVVVLINPSQSARNISFTPQRMSASAYQVISHSVGTAKPVLTANGAQLTASIPPRCYAVFASNAVAGVDDIVADAVDSNAVYGGQGEIIVNGDASAVEVYNIAGQRQASLQVPAGIYIVRFADGTTTKVVVK
ncbi:MAG: T9SS type A sorting domain-containing protein, partial [Muribaculaceae bacterium]|nr:T9SS type A sorting domain-containing protein [Muribaculaceae bacterium]